MHLNAEMLEDEQLTQEGLEIVTGLIYENSKIGANYRTLPQYIETTSHPNRKYSIG